MPSKERYHITKREDGQWQGKKEGSNRASSVESTQEKAIKVTTEIAKNNGEAHVLLLGAGTSKAAEIHGDSIVMS